MSGQVRQVIFHTPGKAWVQGLNVLAQPGVSEHFAYIKVLHERGDVIAAGPFVDAQSGGMLVLHERLSAEDAAAIVRKDPGVASGLVEFQIRAWLITVAAQEAPASLIALERSPLQGV